MSDHDRLKWNDKYRNTPSLLERRPPSELLKRFKEKAPGHTAIDLACGTGRNARYLIQEGFEVDAVDISTVALEKLAQETQGLPIRCIEEDLESFTPEKERYDLLVMTNFLDRDLIVRCAEGMKSGALFLIETYMAHPENEKKNSHPDFLLAPEELKAFFDEGFNLLAYEELWNEPYEIYRMRKEAIVVQKR